MISPKSLQGEIPQEQNSPPLVKIMQLSIISPVMPVLLWSTLTGSFILRSDLEYFLTSFNYFLFIRMTMWLLCQMGGILQFTE